MFIDLISCVEVKGVADTLKKLPHTIKKHSGYSPEC